MINSPHTATFQLAARAAIAAVLSVEFAQLLRLEYPLYALISAVIVTDLDASQTRKSGLPRLAGTVLGATLGAMICSVVQPGAWAIGAGILGAMLLSDLLRLRNAARLTGYICGIVLLDHGDHPWFYALYRTMETAIGIGAAMLVSFVPRLIPTAKKPEEPAP